MALTPALIYADLAAARTSGGFSFSGREFDHLAWAIGYGVVDWFQSRGVTLRGVCVGTAGMGAINTGASTLILAPSPALVIGGLASAGMGGPLSVSLGKVVASGLARSVSSYGQYTGGVVGVGIGDDVSQVGSTDGPALTALLLAYMSSLLGSGPASAQMAAGLGTGIAAMLLTLTGRGNVVGSASVVPASGFSTSVVV